MTAVVLVATLGAVPAVAQADGTITVTSSVTSTCPAPTLVGEFEQVRATEGDCTVTVTDLQADVGPPKYYGLEFGDPVDVEANLDLTSSTSPVTYDDAVTLDGVEVATGGQLEFRAPVTIDGDVKLASTTTSLAYPILFDGGIYDGAVGGTGSLEIADDALFADRADYPGASYPVSLPGAGQHLQLDHGVTVTFNGDVDAAISGDSQGVGTAVLEEDVDFVAGGEFGQVTDVPFSYNLSVGAAATFDGDVDVASLTVTGEATLGSGVTIHTHGNQIYDGTPTSLLLAGSTGATLSTDQDTFGTGIYVAGTTTAQDTGPLTFDGETLLGGDVDDSGGKPISDLTFDGPLGLNIASPSFNLATSGTQTFDGPVNLAAGDTGGTVTFTTGSGNFVDFKSTLDGAEAVTDAGRATFEGAVGQSSPLESLEDEGPTVLGASVTTGDSGSQAYDGFVTLTGNATLTTGTDQQVAFDGGVALGDHALTIDSQKEPSLSYPITGGSSSALSFVDTLPGTPHPAFTFAGAGPDGLTTIGTQFTITLVGTAAAPASLGSAKVDGELDIGSDGIVGDVTVDSGGKLSCTNDGTITGTVTNDGTVDNNSLPARPTLGAATAGVDEATVSFTVGGVRCNPTFYTVTATPASGSGGVVSTSGAGSPITVTGLQPGTTYEFTLAADNPLGATPASGSKAATTVSAPTATISSPADAQSFTQGQDVPTAFSCTEGAGGTGIASCTDSDGGSAPGGKLDTSTPGTHTYTVTARSKDGLTGTARISYTVLAPSSGGGSTTTGGGSTTTGGGSTTTGGGSTTTGTATRHAGRVKVAAKAPVSRRRVASLKLSCRRGACTGKVTLTETVKKRVKKHGRWVTEKKTVTLGKAFYRLAGGATKRLRVKLSAAAYKQLNNGARHKLTVTAVVTQHGMKKAVKKRVTLTEAKKKKKP